ncbi:MAG: VOC family protein [Vulcanimicrobiaceae bacterium]
MSGSQGRAGERRLLSHIDVRVADRARATAFYDALFGALDFTGRTGEEWTSYADRSQPGPMREWFGFTVDPAQRAGTTRVAFTAETRADVDRIAAVVRNAGAKALEGPDESEGYYALFFEDPDGNRLEVCFID